MKKLNKTNNTFIIFYKVFIARFKLAATYKLAINLRLYFKWKQFKNAA